MQVEFSGDSLNKDGLGTWIELHYENGKQQAFENTPYRGYLSTGQAGAHFGLGKTASVDSVVIKWPNGKMQLLRNVPADRLLKVDIHNADQHYSFSQETIAKNTLFRDITDSLNIHFRHQEKDYIDFNIQKLLPHKFSEYGPALAVADIDGNGLDDIICGGSSSFSAQIFLQQLNGKFIQKPLLTDEDLKDENRGQSRNIAF